MNRKHHKIFDTILKIIIVAYLNDFFEYICVEKRIVEVLKTEITTLNGKTIHLDFLCLGDDGKLYDVEFQFTGPDGNDLERFFDYNIIANVRHDKIVESIVVNFRTKKSGVKEIEISETIDFHPKFCHLGDRDYEKILNNIENKVKDNKRLTSFEEISLMIMALLPKYKNKTEILKEFVEFLKIRIVSTKKQD